MYVTMYKKTLLSDTFGALGRTTLLQNSSAIEFSPQVLEIVQS